MAASRNGRILTEQDDVWSHNAWDSVPWNEERVAQAEDKIAIQKVHAVPDHLAEQYNAKPASYWDKTYSQVEDRMYQDRSWLLKEFKPLRTALSSEAGPRRIVEIGSGPGNTFFPLLKESQNPSLQLHAFDYSRVAIDLLKANPVYSAVGNAHAAVYDISSSDLPPDIAEASVDVAIMIFVLSALHPSQWPNAIRNVQRMLKPGGYLLFRDFGRYDLCQLRFKKERWMADNLYVRGDGTRVYFFDLDELRQLVASQSVEGTHLKEVTLDYDRRLLLNRKRQLQMFRVWLQGIFVKE